MSEPSKAFALTPRQRRLRIVTLILILFIAVMLTISVLHPFFHPGRPDQMTEQVRRALAAQYMLILAYYSVIFALALALLVIAWLYMRDIRLQLALARRDMWQKIVDDRASARRTRSEKRQGNGADGSPS